MQTSTPVKQAARTIVVRRDKAHGVWVATINGIDTLLPWDVRAASEFVAARIQAENPNTRVGIRASDIGSVVALMCLLRGDGKVFWMKAIVDQDSKTS